MNESNFFTAILNGNSDEVASLLAADPSWLNTKSTHGLSPVLFAAYYNEPQLAVWLAKRTDHLSIHEACAVGMIDPITRLIQENPLLVNDFSEDGFQPLGLASFFGHPVIVDYLLREGAEVNTPSRNPMRVMPLHSACARGDLSSAELLIAAGADVNARQQGDFTPLHAAAQNGNAALVRLLLAAHADKSLRAASGDTPYDFAMKSGSRETMDLLTP